MKNEGQLRNLFCEISNKRDELDKELNVAIANKMESAERYLKERKLQCDAQIRLLNYILGDIDDKEYIMY